MYPYIVKQVDFDFCKNVYGIDKNGNEYVKIHKISDVMRRNSIFNFRNHKSIKRYNKYILREFNFDVPDSYYEKILKYYQRSPYYNIYEVESTDNPYIFKYVKDGMETEIYTKSGLCFSGDACLFSDCPAKILKVNHVHFWTPVTEDAKNDEHDERKRCIRKHIEILLIVDYVHGNHKKNQPYK